MRHLAFVCKCHFHFQQGVKDAVRITSSVQREWADSLVANDNFVIWHYMTVDNKVLRVFPGVQVDKGYMPKNVGW